jgi:membrane protein insertase Oxa1/YidC/SpoIIIJ
MPIMFGFFSLQFPAGLSIYFILSNVIGIGQSMLTRSNKDVVTVAPATAIAAPEKEVSAREGPTLRSSNGQPSRSANRPVSKRKRRSAKR